MDEQTLVGGCRCGRVRFEARSKSPRNAVCGCRDCQRSSGSVLSVAVGFHSEKFAVTAGDDVLRFYADVGESGEAVHRYFCGECGSPLFARPQSYTSLVSVRTMALDEPIESPPGFAIFVSNIPSWIRLPEEAIAEGEKLD